MAKILKFHASMIAFSTTMGIMFNPYYDNRYSWRHNCIDGGEMGLIVGVMWPCSFPIITYYYVKHLVNTAPIREIELTDWTKEWRLKTDKFLKDMKDMKDKKDGRDD